MVTTRAIMLALAALTGALVLFSFAEGRRDPVVRQARIVMADWPRGAAPLRVVLLSDIHAGTVSTGVARLRRIGDLVRSLRPDLILIAGDFSPGHDTITADAARKALAPLSTLRAPLGVLAVPGNHDHWTGLTGVRAALRAAGVTMLANQAVRRGPLVIAAVDDDYSEHARVIPTLAAARNLPGARVVLTHSPDIAPQLANDFPLLLAGHTHCGQAVLPFWGSLDPVSRYDDRYRCGIIREGRRTVIVTAGIGGTIPFRFRAPPDLWLLTLGP